MDLLTFMSYHPTRDARWIVREYNKQFGAWAKRQAAKRRLAERALEQKEAWDIPPWVPVVNYK